MGMVEIRGLDKKKAVASKKNSENTTEMAVDETAFLSAEELEAICSGSDAPDEDFKIPVIPEDSTVELEIVSGTATGKKYLLTKNRITIGRGDSDFNFNDIQASRKHASIELIPGGYISLRDLASTNGTLLNGKEATSRLLKNGDIITIGKTEIKVNVSSEESDNLV